MEIQIDPAALTAETGRNAVPIPALLAAFRTEMAAPEHAAHVHHGATSQDIIDTALSLRLRQVLSLYETRLDAILSGLATLARTHAHLPMAARTWDQIATPTSFGAICAAWGHPLLTLRHGLEALKPRVLLASLSGAAGTASVIHPHGPGVRAALAEGLGLHDPGYSWHADRTPRSALAAWITQTMVQLGRIGEDLRHLSSSAQGEVILPGSGGSSTMPHKQNPVQPSVLCALALHSTGLNTTVQQAGLHRAQRDGGAWMAEWLALPQMACGLGKALAVAEALVQGITPNADRMRRNIDADGGLIYAEALTFHLARAQPRPKAQAAVKALCARSIETGTTLQTLAQQAYPAEDLAAVFTPALGHAPDEAVAFADKMANQ